MPVNTAVLHIKTVLKAYKRYLTNLLDTELKNNSKR